MIASLRCHLVRSGGYGWRYLHLSSGSASMRAGCWWRCPYGGLRRRYHFRQCLATSCSGRSFSSSHPDWSRMSSRAYLYLYLYGRSHQWFRCRLHLRSGHRPVRLSVAVILPCRFCKPLLRLCSGRYQLSYIRRRKGKVCRFRRGWYHPFPGRSLGFPNRIRYHILSVCSLGNWRWRWHGSSSRWRGTYRLLPVRYRCFPFYPHYR